MSFDEGRKFTAELVDQLFASKEKLAEYDKDFLEKITNIYNFKCKNYFL